MKKLLIIPAILFSLFVQSQPDTLFLKPKKTPYDGPQWKQKNKAVVDINEVAFVNWNAGGSNSISALVGLESSLNYRDKYFSWKNSANFRYGINKQESRELRKTDDLIEVNSSMGYKPDIISNWFYSAKLNFRTQLANGYKYPNKDVPISRFMAPGYLFIGAGMEYGRDIENFGFYFSPLTLKATFVLDEDLANAGAFGVEPAVYDSEENLIRPGERLRKEIGLLLTNNFETPIFENIDLKNQVSLYTDYVNNFGNVDVDWRVDFDFKVNNYVRATFGSHIRYDDDVKTLVETNVEGEFDEAGAKIQWKQFLGVGFAVDF